MGLPGPLAQGNDKIDQLLVENVLEASKLYKIYQANNKCLKKVFSPLLCSKPRKL